MTKALSRGIPIFPAQCFYDAGMVLGGKRDPPGIAQVRTHVSPRDLPERRNSVAKAAIGASFQQHTVPFLVQGHAAVDIAPDSRELSVYFGEAIEPVR